MTLSIFEMRWDDTTSFPPMAQVETITKRLTPSPRRPEATPPSRQERDSFSLVAGSTGEPPIFPAGTGDPAETARIWAPVAYGRPVEPPRRRWWYRGQRRMDRSRAALNAACAQQGGAR